eukprot:TRINITY_DN44560_c0_g1_i1.p1 TRINITY_DN44560_c0_g1~~TRINITY_DN44560_c0_g1_i1.p1  ORF type:complete len:491 (-),score=50.91 TRINITY_DN44560_c0_g1_i1:50-1522(-)
MKFTWGRPFFFICVAAAECASERNSSCEVRTGSDLAVSLPAVASVFTIDEADSVVDATSLLQVRHEFSTKKKSSEQFFTAPSSQVEATCANFSSTFWQDYAKFHSAGREALARGESRPTLIWQCTDEDHCGGIGDQVRNLLIAFLFAVKSKRIFLIGAWSKSDYDIHSLFETSRIDVYFDSLPLICRESRYHRTEIGILRLLAQPCMWVASSQFDKIPKHADELSASSQFDRIPKHVNELSASSQFSKIPNHADELSSPMRHTALLDATGLSVASNQSTQMPMLANAASDLLPHIGCAFNFLLRPSPKYRALQATRMPIKAGSRYISVHVRMGDYVMDNRSLAQSDVRSSSASESLEAALRCALQAPVVADTILVFSDSAEVKSLAVNNTWVSDTLGSEIAGYKVNTTRDAEGNVFAPKHTELNLGASQDGVISAWADQAILADSVAVIRTSGGFARSAAVMGLVPILWTASKDGQCKHYGIDEFDEEPI